MKKTLKQFFSGAWIIVAIVAFILIPIFLISWYTANFDWIYSILVNISGIVIWIILPLALLISLVPRAREITGTTIVVCSWALGVILWLINLYNSIATVGFVWTIFGIVFVGVGVFITSGIGLILNGEFSGLIFMLFMLVGIYGIRLLGLWIATKKPSQPSKKAIEKMANDTARILSKPTWKLRGYDTFEGMPYKIPGDFDSESLAQAAAEKYLKEKIEPLQGKPTPGGIQDRISIIRPDGTSYRYKDPV